VVREGRGRRVKREEREGGKRGRGEEGKRHLI
jgi:hypothetical protein